MPSTSASFDFLFVSRELSSKLGVAKIGEVHLFAYLGCLLSVFGGQPASDWGYGFAGLEAGAPFSPELQATYAELERADFVEGSAEDVSLTSTGLEQLEMLQGLHSFASRSGFLNPACASLLAFPVGMVRSAMSMEPGLRPVLHVGGMRPLLSTTSLDQLYDHFAALVAAVGQTSDLVVPSTVWLTYLLELSRERDRNIVSGQRFG